MRILFCGGGTAGHVYPNIAIAETFLRNEPNTRLAYVTTVNGIENELITFKKYQIDVIGLKRAVSLKNIKCLSLLLKGINDSQEHANQLAKLIKGTFSYVNLIPYNSVDEKVFKRTSKEEILSFQDKLKKLGVNVTIRKEFGTDIDAACGQLRAKKLGVLKDE